MNQSKSSLQTIPLAICRKPRMRTKDPGKIMKQRPMEAMKRRPLRIILPTALAACCAKALELEKAGYQPSKRAPARLASWIDLWCLVRLPRTNAILKLSILKTCRFIESQIHFINYFAIFFGVFTFQS